MGPVHWPSVLAAALVALALAPLWYGALFKAAPHPPLIGLALALLIPASLIGHNFARVGPTELAAKPWLYWMMSGGFALTMIAPALAITTAQRRLGVKAWAIDAGYWLAAFLLMGTVFRFAA